jgi:hypothetical protein
VLANNSLREIPSEMVQRFADYKRPGRLDLSSNGLQAFPKGWEALDGLTQLFLFHNNSSRSSPRGVHSSARCACSWSST